MPTNTKIDAIMVFFNHNSIDDKDLKSINSLEFHQNSLRHFISTNHVVTDIFHIKQCNIAYFIQNVK